MYDLDYEAAALCRDLGLNFVRAGTAGTHPCVIAMLAELIEERQSGVDLPLCAADCCPAPSKQNGRR
jgi:ferrochelatase